jgi:ketosteroid isomerase-like protein
MLALTAFTAAVTGAAAQPDQPTVPQLGAQVQSADYQKLEALNARWLKSYETKDRAALAAVLAEDFIGQYGKTALSKTQMLDRLATRPPTRVSWTGLQINVNGGTALVAGESTIRTTLEGHETSARYSYADVYVRRAGEWRAIASHVVRLPD